MICVSFGTVLTVHWTKYLFERAQFRTNDPSGSANLVRSGPPDPASATPTANPREPVVGKAPEASRVYHTVPLNLNYNPV